MVDSQVVREVGVALAGIVMGAAIIAMFRYRKHYLDSTGEATRTRLLLAIWTVGTIGAFAVLQGVTRAILISEKMPIDYRDWTAIILQVNALALLVAIMRSERSVADGE